MTRHIIRAVRWQPLLLCSLLACVLTGWRTPRLHDPAAALPVLRAVALLLAVGCTALLDDPAAALLAASPTPLWRRRAYRTLPAAAGVLLVWAGSLGWADARLSAALPAGGLAVELAGLTTAGLALAAVLHRRGIAEPGVLAAPAVLLAALLGTQLRGPWRLVADPGPQWAVAHLRWAAALITVAAVFACASRDPWRAGRTVTFRPRRVGAARA